MREPTQEHNSEDSWQPDMNVQYVYNLLLVCQKVILLFSTSKIPLPLSQSNFLIGTMLILISGTSTLILSADA